MPKRLNFKIPDTTSKLWNFYLPMMLIGIGILIRSWTYLQNQCLWQDEGWWAHDILSRPIGDILTAAGGYKMQMPVGLGAAIKILVQFFGGPEYVLRLIPFLCSVGTLFAYDYFLRLVSNSFVRCLALSLLAVLSLPVYYASELRPYSCDVLGLLVMLCIAMKVREHPNSRRQWILFALIGLLMPWFSFSPLFILPAIMCVFLLDIQRLPKSMLPAAVCVFLSWGVNLAALYFLFYQKIDGYSPFKSMVQEGLLSYPLSWTTLTWMAERIHFYLASVGLIWIFACCMLAALGFLKITKTLHTHQDQEHVTARRYFVAHLFIIMIVLVILASALHKYPLLPRLQLFLIPLFLWFMAEGIHAFWLKKSRWIKISVLLVTLTLWTNCLYRTGHEQLWVKPDMRSALKFMCTKQKTGDLILIVEASQYAYFYYAWYFSYPLDVNRWARFTHVNQNSDKRKYMGIQLDDSLGHLYTDGAIQWITTEVNKQQNFQALLPPGRMWVLFSDSGDERFLLNQLNQYGKKIEQWNDYRVDLYLYEFPGN